MVDVNYIARGGEHPNLETEQIEREVMNWAMQLFAENLIFQKKGLQWTYNWAHFHYLYSTRDPKKTEYLFKNRPYPDYIEVETSTFCNLKCTMCEHSYWCEKNENMTFEQFKSILDQFPKLKWIGLTGIGESYLNPDFYKIMKLCKDRNIFIENFDNFVLLDESKARELVELGVDKLYVSLDAATKETYEKIRVGANWETVIDHIKTLDRIKKEAKSPFPEFWFHMIVSKDNIHECEAYLDLINSLDIDVKQAQYTILLHPYSQIKNKFVDMDDDLKKRIMAKSQKLGIPVSFNINTGCKSPLSSCSLWTMPFIFVDGTVIACCSMNEQNDRSWQRKTSLGNIFEKPFREIWYGEKYDEMLNAIKENKNCAACSRCFLFK